MSLYIVLFKFLHLSLFICDISRHFTSFFGHKKVLTIFGEFDIMKKINSERIIS